MPMETPPAEDTMHDLFRAKYTTKYLEDYVSSKSHANQTLRDRIQFNTDVKTIRKIDGRWQLVWADTTDGSQRSLFSSRLMVANG